MTDSWPRRLMVSALIALLHLPLIFHALSLYAELGPGKGVLDFDPSAAILLIVFVLLPHVILLSAGIRWNPERAHPGEPL